MVMLADKTRVAGTRFDKRRRLTEEDKADIRSDYERGEGIRAIARCYGVSRRLIQFVLFPERLEQNLLCRAKRGGSRAYYDKDKQCEYMRKCRAHKKDLLERGLVEVVQ